MASRTSAWVLREQGRINSLELIQDHALRELGEHDVLVKLYAASLNYREIVIAKGEPALPFFRPGVVPGSDGAGVVEAVGSNVRAFKVGDRVCTHLTSQMPAADPPTMHEVCRGLGQKVDGTLRSHGVFHDTELVAMPAGLTFLEASTLTCSGLTAWNALFGVRGYVPGSGDVVLVQGTGGVSIAALQFALAAGSTVIATTSSDAKMEKLKALGAQHVINYRADPKWGETAKSLSSDGKGVNVVVDVGGLSTLSQSFNAVRIDGMVAVTGLLGGSNGQDAVPTMMDCLYKVCTARGIVLGTRDQFREMNAFVEEKGIRPVVDEKVFGFHEAREAYEYLQQQHHFSKVCIQLQGAE